MNESTLNRRQFYGRSLTGASVVAASYQRILGANDRIGVANIGCGRRNLLRELIQVRTDANIEISVVCDTRRQKREKEAAEVKEHTGRDPQQMVRYQEILTRNAIDAVVIGTPDHLEYPGDFLVRYCTVFGNSAGRLAKCFGARGTLDAKNLSRSVPWTVSGEGSGDPDRIAAETELPMEKRVHHMQNFLDCVRTRETLVAPIEAGYARVVAVIMADDAMVSSHRQVYDPV